MFGLMPSTWAQPADNNTWDTTFSFSGTGNLPVGAFFTGNPNDVLIPLTATMSGAGENTANANGEGGFTVDSSFRANVGITGLPGYPTLAITPAGPGIPMSTPTTTVTANSSAPFYGLFPPPSGTVYTSQANFSTMRYFDATYDEIVNYLGVDFRGPMTLTLGGTPTVSTTPDGSLPGDDFYSFSYANSSLSFNETLSGDDPLITFTGNLVITTTAPAPVSVSAPETSSFLGDVLMLALFAAGVKCLRLKFAAGSPA